MLKRLPKSHDPQQHVRLDTLIRLRWASVIGQATAVIVVEYGLDFEPPFWPCIAEVAVSAWLIIALMLHGHASPRIAPDQAGWLLAFDVAQLAARLFLTGGLQNPVSLLLLAPVLIG